MKNKLELTDKELHLIECACRCLWDSLDITNSELKNRTSDVAKENYEQNIKDMEVLNRILNKIKEMEYGSNK